MVRKTLKYFVYAIYGLCAIAVLVFLLPVGLKAKEVATGSMHPAIPQGSLVIIRSVPYSQINVGDIITYKDPRKPGQTITHRVVAKQLMSGVPFFTTKGDANPTEDPQIVGGEIQGKVVWNAAYLGSLLTLAKKPLGLAVIVIIPGLLIIIDESRRMHRSINLAQQKKAEKSEEPPAPPGGGTKITEPGKATQVERPKRTIDGMIRRSAVMLIFAPILLIGVTHAAFTTNRVTLANNRLCVLKTTSPTPSPATGAGSTNTTTVINTTNITISNTNDTSVTNFNKQWGLSGGVNANGNTSIGGSVTSGDVSNSNSTTTTITNTNGSPTPSVSPSPSPTTSPTPTPTPTPTPSC